MPVSLSKSQVSASATTAPGLLGWLKEHLGQPRAELHTKLRGNILHVLCETPDALDQSSVLLRLVRALLEDQDQGWLHQTYPQVYQIYLYSRRQNQPHPDWTAPIYLNRLERHLAQLVLENQGEEDLQAAQTLLASYAQDHPQILQNGATGGGAIVLSNLSLARKGDPEAIAWYLSETLSALDVGVWVSVKAIPGLAHLHRRAIRPDHPSPEGLADEGSAQPPGPQAEEATIPRLWILCEAAYSPDPSLIARPTAERLRRLQLTQFKDAVLLLQVRGEAKPDWSLRIDLTPPEEMLREWSRWGDVASLGRLMASILERYHLTVETTLNGDTLHVLCQPQGEADHPVPTVVQSQADIVDTLASTLEELAPQGIHRAILYGQPDPQAEPAWVHYLDLPAAQHSALADSSEYLGQMGDLPALAFLLTRQLNPNLEDRLATGGQRVQLLQRDQLLHIMVDGPVVPQRRLVAPLLNNYLLSLSPVGLEGVRIYGRRSGQNRPAWSYGRDFAERSRLVPEATPEFTASDAYVNELLVRPDSPITHAELSPEAEAEALAQWWTTVVDRWQGILVQSQLFSRSQSLSVLDRSPSPQPTEGLKIAAVWATVGVLLALQADWLLGQMLRPPANTAKAEPMVTLVTPPPDPDAEFAEALAELDWPNGQTTGTEGEFVDGTTDLFASPSQPLVAIDDLVADSPFSTFNSEQMNEKLALYRQRLATEGPADVMIVGSSRALRGVDPEALRRELAALGYDNLSIFNFGINGATAQVVDLVLRQALTPEQLPRLILWADGARAFNSGREDVTYNAIVASPGYRELMTQRPDAPPAPGDQEGGNAAFGANGRSLPQSYAAMDEWLSDRIGEFSSVHPNRDSLKTLVQSQLGTVTPSVGGDMPMAPEQLDAPMPAGSSIDRDGFLPLSVRFNPATYYQTYARVSGRYDGDYEAFRLDGVQVEALSELLRFTQDRNIPIVFINTPLSDEYLDDYRQAAEDEFLRHMLTLSTTESGFLFRDLGQVWPDQYDYFSDPSHLNRYGAYQVSQRLAQDPLIAWPRRSSPPAP